MKNRKAMTLWIGLPDRAPPSFGDERADYLAGLYLSGPDDPMVIDLFTDALQDAGRSGRGADACRFVLQQHRHNCESVAEAVALCCGDGDVSGTLRAEILTLAGAFAPWPSVYVRPGNWGPYIIGRVGAGRIGVAPGSILVGADWIIDRAKRYRFTTAPGPSPR